VTTIIFLALTFLPEVLVLSGGPALAPPTGDAQVVVLQVDGMGCEVRHTCLLYVSLCMCVCVYIIRDMGCEVRHTCLFYVSPCMCACVYIIHDMGCEV